jgi:phosphoenolpyruvate carboxykinase (ATP)
MHCSANVGIKGDVSLFFGLSGTGKTTLSSETFRKLIGDDEHGWSEKGVFNFEGGCYAKTIGLNQAYEPGIWNAVNRFGSVIENVVFNKISREIEFENNWITENTRGAYPLEYVDQRIESGYSGHPDTIFFLAADAFGVLPPLSKLNTDQALYYFLSGYTSKLAGTESGLGIEPQATFSTCFAAPFLPLHPKVYADLLGERMRQHHTKVWLINTGWTGGPCGIGNRISLPYSRRLIQAALSTELNGVNFHEEPFFKLSIPEHCPGVPHDVLNPAKTWKSQKEYTLAAQKLVGLFQKNFTQYENLVSTEVRKAGP